MAESDGKYHQKRGNYVPNRSNRSRPGHNRIYNNLGVRDLREIIDKKRQERGDDHVDSNKVPPPDPSYNYLKDPLRESGEESSHPHRKGFNKKTAYYKNKPKSSAQGNFPHNLFEHPFDIKVEFSTSTGEHVYTVDESTLLATKHVPDRTTPSQKRFFNNRIDNNSRGRGWRGHARSDFNRSYHTRTINRNRNYEEKKFEHFNKQSNQNKQLDGKSNETETWDNEIRSIEPNCDNTNEVWDDAVADNGEEGLDKSATVDLKDQSLVSEDILHELETDFTNKLHVENTNKDEKSSLEKNKKIKDKKSIKNVDVNNSGKQNMKINKVKENEIIKE